MATTATLDLVLDALRDSLDELIDETCTRIWAELDSYADISREALAAAVTRNLNTSLSSLELGRAPVPSMLDGAALTSRERFAVGVPVEEIGRGFRISIALIHERFQDLAISYGLSPDEILRGSRVLWAVSDVFTTRIITTYNALELDTALRNAQRRVQVIRALLAGEFPDDPMLSAIDPRGSYAAVRCDPPEGMDAERVRRQLEISGSTPEAPALIVQDGSSCLGVVSRRPRDSRLAVGMGPFVRPDDLARSDRTAREALQLARRLGRVGVQSMAELGWRLAAVRRPDIWADYYQRFAAPVLAEGEFGVELMAAVRAWTANGRSISKTAAKMNLHVNTVRYRMARYCELTQADLDDPDDLMAICWAIELGDPESFGF